MLHRRQIIDCCRQSDVSLGQWLRYSGMNYSYLGSVLMAEIEKISVALPHEMVSIVREAVERGEYASSSEVIRDALRDWTLKRKYQAIADQTARS